MGPFGPSISTLKRETQLHAGRFGNDEMFFRKETDPAKLTHTLSSSLRQPGLYQSRIPSMLTRINQPQIINGVSMGLAGIINLLGNGTPPILINWG